MTSSPGPGAPPPLKVQPASSTPALVATGTKPPPTVADVGPGRITRFRRGWMRASEVAAHGLGYVVFSLLWLFAFAPLALIMKLLRRRFLPRFRGDEPTYYLQKPKIEPTMSFMKRQW